MIFEKNIFGMMPDGTEISLFTLTNSHDMKVKVTNFGANWVSLDAPDRKGNFADVTLGYDNLEGYINDTAYLGATVGRYACGIGNGGFTLNGIKYKLALNTGKKHAHGGVKGFNKVIWNAEEINDEELAGVRFTYASKDGEEGYPGNLSVAVSYILNDDNEVTIQYEAETDKPTVVNLTNHSYFNLTGDVSQDILNHELTLDADRQIVLNDIGLPKTGETESIKGTSFDFTKSEKIGARIGKTSAGYDQCYVLRKSNGQLALAAKVYEPGSGRVMEIHTTELGMVFYTANFLEGAVGKGGKVYHNHHAFCLEPQHFPDSPNHPEFPTVVLNPGEQYRQTSVYKFYTE